MGPLEIAAAALIAASVLLTVRRSLWLWPTGIAGTALYLVLFAAERLYFSAALQAFFLVVQGYGWWWWSARGHGRERPITALALRRTAVIFATVVPTCAVVGLAAGALSDAAWPLPDALIAGLSVVAQVLLSRKILENWLFWISVDVLAVGVYAAQGLVATAALYAGLLAMATWGWFAWRRAWRAS